MENKVKPPLSVSFFKWLLLVFAILTSFSFLTVVLSLIRPRSGQSFHISFVFLYAVASLLFFIAFLALQKRKRHARWIAVISFALAAFNVTWGVFWYFFMYQGPKNIFATGLVVGFDIIQFALFVWGALTFAFPPKVIADDTHAESHLPPPPPSFDE